MRFVVRSGDVEPIHLPGREMRRLITTENVSAENMSVGVIWVPPGAEVLPLHSHEAEEALYIVTGNGEYWIDGELGHFQSGDIVWFPYNCKHMVRNTGESVLQAVCIFSPPMHPERYTLYKGIQF